MNYNSSTGSYQNDNFEQILDSEYRYDIPYRIDREKYAKIIKQHNKDMRIVDADVVTFRTDYNLRNDSDNEYYLYAFYAFPKNSPEGSKDFYDCFLFMDYDYNHKHKEAYEHFVHDIIDCIIEVDKEYLNKVKSKLISKLNEVNMEIDIVDKILV